MVLRIDDTTADIRLERWGQKGLQGRQGLRRVLLADATGRQRNMEIKALFWRDRTGPWEAIMSRSTRRRADHAGANRFPNFPR